MKFVPKTILTIPFKGVLTLAVTAFAAVSSIAQNAPPPPTGPGPVPPGLPIDGGLVGLIVVAAAFGIYKIHQSQNKKAQI